MIAIDITAVSIAQDGSVQHASPEVAEFVKSMQTPDLVKVNQKCKGANGTNCVNNACS